MYTNIEGREKSTLEMDKLRYEVMQEKYQAASDMIDSLTGSGNVTFTSKDKTTSQKNFIANNPTKTLADWNLLSGEEKLSYLDEGEDTDSEAIDSYVNEIILAKAKKSPSVYYDEDNKTIKWNSIPQSQRDAVRKKYNEKIKELIANSQAKAKTDDDGILSRLKRLLGMNDKNNSD
jgi:hypothetical protein